jgi:hypothetical protein
MKLYLLTFKNIWGYTFQLEVAGVTREHARLRAGMFLHDKVID